MLSEKCYDQLSRFADYCIEHEYLENLSSGKQLFVNELIGHVVELSQSNYSHLLQLQSRGELPLKLACRESEFLLIAEQQACREVIGQYRDGLQLADLPADGNDPETIAAIRQLIQERKADVAARKIRQCLEEKNNNEELQYLLGRCFEIAGRFDEALTCYKQAVESGNNEYVHAMATLYLTIGDYEQAIPAFDQAINLSPSFAGNWHNKGICLFQQELYSDALSMFEKAIELDSGFIGSHVNAARSHTALGTNELALHSFCAALQIEPDNQEALKGRGILYQLQEQHDLAVKDLSRVIQAGVDDLDIYAIRCRSLLAIGQFEAASGDAGLIRSHEPYSIEAISSQLKSQIGLKEYSRALITLKELLDIAPNLREHYQEELELLKSKALIASH